MKTSIVVSSLSLILLFCSFNHAIASSPWGPGEDRYQSKEMMPGGEYQGGRYKGFFLLHMFSPKDENRDDSVVIEGGAIDASFFPVNAENKLPVVVGIEPQERNGLQNVPIIDTTNNIQPSVDGAPSEEIPVDPTVKQDSEQQASGIVPADSLSGRTEGTTALSPVPEGELAPSRATSNLTAEMNVVPAKVSSTALVPEANIAQNPVPAVQAKVDTGILAPDTLKLNADMATHNGPSRALIAANPVVPVNVYETGPADWTEWLANVREYQSSARQEDYIGGYRSANFANNQGDSGRIVRQRVLIIEPLKETWYKVAYFAALREEKALMFQLTGFQQGIVPDIRLLDPLGALSSKAGLEQYYVSNARQEASKLLSDPAVSNLYLNLQ